MSRFKGWTAESVEKLTGKKIKGTKKKENKYRNIKTIYNGVTYDSKFEAEFAQKLDLWKRFGQIKDWKRQVPFELKVEGEKICKYVIDFCIIHFNGKEEYIEIKGKETAAFRLKKKLFLQTHKDIRYRIIKREEK